MVEPVGHSDIAAAYVAGDGDGSRVRILIAPSHGVVVGTVALGLVLLLLHLGLTIARLLHRLAVTGLLHGLAVAWLLLTVPRLRHAWLSVARLWHTRLAISRLLHAGLAITRLLHARLSISGLLHARLTVSRLLHAGLPITRLLHSWLTVAHLRLSHHARLAVAAHTSHSWLLHAHTRLSHHAGLLHTRHHAGLSHHSRLLHTRLAVATVHARLRHSGLSEVLVLKLCLLSLLFLELLCLLSQLCLQLGLLGISRRGVVTLVLGRLKLGLFSCELSLLSLELLLQGFSLLSHLGVLGLGSSQLLLEPFVLLFEFRLRGLKLFGALRNESGNEVHRAGLLVLVVDVKPLVDTLVDHERGSLNLDETNSIRGHQILIPHTHEDFIAGAFNLELELLVPLGELATVVVALRLQLLLVVGEGNVGAHVTHELSISRELGTNEFDV